MNLKSLITFFVTGVCFITSISTATNPKSIEVVVTSKEMIQKPINHTDGLQITADAGE